MARANRLRLMNLLNTSSSYGLISILLHWAIALLLIVLIALGLWMTGLDYYHPWYREGPDIHRSLGVLVAGLLIGRLVWRGINRQPALVATDKPWERHAARVTHWLLYLLPALLVVSGYMISTADGRALSVFGWFEIPAVVSGLDNQEDLAGDIHYFLALVLIGFICLHAAAAVKHQIVDRDARLWRMLVPGNDTSTKTE
jgi:cytochrome b561